MGPSDFDLGLRSQGLEKTTRPREGEGALGNLLNLLGVSDDVKIRPELVFGFGCIEADSTDSDAAGRPTVLSNIEWYGSLGYFEYHE